LAEDAPEDDVGEGAGFASATRSLGMVDGAGSAVGLVGDLDADSSTVAGTSLRKASSASDSLKRKVTRTRASQ
jgi:hypothetical protein